MSSAHFQLCRALLDQGHHIDLYGVPGFIPRPDFASPRFAYMPIEVELGREIDQLKAPVSMQPFVARLAGRRRTNRYRDHSMIVARSLHASEPYDAALFLGTAPRGGLDGVPTVVWPQCAPQSELIAVRGLRGPVTRVSGLGAYLRLLLYYEFKDRVTWTWATSHHIVLASRASRDIATDFGVSAKRVCVTPYAIDLQRFSPGPTPTAARRTVLCVGRLDPRKRVDLLIDAVRVLAARRSDFDVHVIGRDAYIPGWAAWVQKQARGLPITYSDAVPQSEIVERLRTADVVVQPSEQEEFGHAVAEALACGVPVVTGPTNGTGEYTPAGASVRFERYEADSLAAAIERALALSREPATRAACREAASAFDPDRVARAVADHVRLAMR